MAKRKPVRIVLNGLPASGKDTVADYLVKEYGFTKMAFADGIYQIAEDYFGMKTKDRQLLRDIGEKLRDIDEDVWVDSTLKKANKLDRVVITDCRRNNEYDKSALYNYYPIKILAKEGDIDKRAELRDGKTIGELTECELQAYDKMYIEVKNIGTFGYLINQIDWIMRDMGVEKI